MDAFNAEAQALIDQEAKKGRRFLIDQKRGSGEWRAEVWEYAGSTWFKRASAVEPSLLYAMRHAAQRSDKRTY